MKNTPLKLAWAFANELVKHVKNKAKTVTPTEYKKRMELCFECPFFAKGPERCTLCGCHMPTKGKWQTTQCADNKNPKWERLDGVKRS